MKDSNEVKEAKLEVVTLCKAVIAIMEQNKAYQTDIKLAESYLKIASLTLDALPAL